MSWWFWVLGTWAVVGGSVAVWSGRALRETERQEGREPAPETPAPDDGSGAS